MKIKGKKIDFISIILIIILIIVCFCYAQLKIFNKDHINFLGFTIFQVITGSMAETIQINDIVIVKLTNDVNVNDIITYRSKDNFVTHRVIEKEENQIITKGDANNMEDEPITSNDVVGKVVFIIPVAMIISIITTPQVAAMLTITIFAGWFLFKRNTKKDVKI